MKINKLLLILGLVFTGNLSFATAQHATLNEQLDMEVWLHTQLAQIVKESGAPFSEGSNYVMDRISGTDWGEYYLHMEPWFQGYEPFCLVVNISDKSVKKATECPTEEYGSNEDEGIITD